VRVTVDPEQLALLFASLPEHGFSATGTMAMEVGGGSVGTTLYEMTWIDRTGRMTALDSSWTFQHSLSNGNVGWSLSPDGRRLAIGLNTNSGDDIWIKELPAGHCRDSPSTRVGATRWTPTESRSHHRGRGWLLRQRPADGTGKEQVLVETPAAEPPRGTWSRAGDWLVRVGGNGPTSAQHPTFRPGVNGAPMELPRLRRRVGAGALARREVVGLCLGRDRAERGVRSPLPQRG
jgi:hypothetical protein